MDLDTTGARDRQPEAGPMLASKRAFDAFDAFDELLATPDEGDATELPEVLVIDDDSSICFALQVYLSGSYAITTCDSGDEGVKRFSSGAHAVILDIKMKGRDGFAT